MDSVELKRLYSREKNRNEKLKKDLEKISRDLDVSSKQLILYEKHMKRIEKIEEDARKKLRKLEELYAQEQSSIERISDSVVEAVETTDHAGDH